MNIHWTAEIGNGSAEFGSPLYGDGVENFATDRNRKDLNFAVFSRPEWLPGLQFGASFLNGELLPYGTTLKVSQDISSIHAVFNKREVEFLNEAVILRHHIVDGRTFNSPMDTRSLLITSANISLTSRFQEVNIPYNDPASTFKEDMRVRQPA